MSNEQVKERTIDDLVKHMHKYKDAVLIIGEKVAPELNVRSLMSKEGEDIFNRKALVKQPQEFWQYYVDNIDVKCIKGLPKVYELLNKLKDTGLIKEVISFNTHGMMDAINIKGTSLKYIVCSKCNKLHDVKIIKEALDNKTIAKELKDGVIEMVSDIPKCPDCNGKLRPNCLMFGENYKYDESQDTLNAIFPRENEGVDIEKEGPKTHTMIYVGVDMEEDFISEIYDNYLLVRERIEDDCYNVIVSDNKGTVQAFTPEFATMEDIEGSLERLIQILDKNE